jgi:hypothetical protein
MQKRDLRNGLLEETSRSRICRAYVLFLSSGRTRDWSETSHPGDLWHIILMPSYYFVPPNMTAGRPRAKTFHLSFRSLRILTAHLAGPERGRLFALKDPLIVVSPVHIELWSVAPFPELGRLGLLRTQQRVLFLNPKDQFKN